MKTNIFKKKGFWLSVCVCLLPIMLSAVFYSRLPDEVATHFGADFTPDGYSQKWTAAFLIPGVLLCLNIFVWFMLENDPKKSGINKSIKALAHWIVPVLSLVSQTGILMYALGCEINLIRFIPLFVGLILIITGNYLPKCRRNYTAGIKLPWTLDNDVNWNKTHRLGGRLMVICGFLLALCSFIQINAAVILGIILFMIIVPVIYSYVLYRRG